MDAVCEVRWVNILWHICNVKADTSSNPVSWFLWIGCKLQEWWLLHSWIEKSNAVCGTIIPIATALVYHVACTWFGVDRQAIDFTYLWINTTLGYYHCACILLVVQSLSIGIHGALLSREWKEVAKLIIQAYRKYCGLESYEDIQSRWQTIAIICSNNISFFQENKYYARINSVLSWFIALILTLPKKGTNYKYHISQ